MMFLTGSMILVGFLSTGRMEIKCHEVEPAHTRRHNGSASDGMIILLIGWFRRGRKWQVSEKVVQPNLQSKRTILLLP